MIAEIVGNTVPVFFTAIVHRKTDKSSEETSGKTSGKILAALSEDRNLTIPDLASLIGVTERSIERNIRKLQEQGRLRRIGPAKGGHWEVQ
jgi:predicted HTH transcriptional regulator